MLTGAKHCIQVAALGCSANGSEIWIFCTLYSSNMQVWTPEQCARAIVETGLHFVDALAIAHCVAQQVLGSKEVLRDEKLIYPDQTN